jgi:hypothetical protein
MTAVEMSEDGAGVMAAIETAKTKRFRGLLGFNAAKALLMQVSEPPLALVSLSDPSSSASQEPEVV